MSIRYRDHNGYEAILGGLTPGGDLSFGAVTTREGSFAIPALATQTGETIAITFSEPLPDADYEVDIYFSVATTSNFTIYNKTASGFVMFIRNNANYGQSNLTGYYKAFKLYEVADAEALYSTVQDIEKAFPADASSSNKLATIRDVTSETRSLDRRIDDLEDYMPSNVSISNKVATQADLANVSIDELGDIEDVDLDDVADGQTLVWDSANSKWVNGAGGKTYTAGDGITISNTDEISAKVDDTSITTDTNDALKVADTYKTIFVGTQAQWDALSTADKVKYNEAHITDDVIGGEVADEVTDGLMSPVTSNAVAEAIDEVNNDLSNKSGFVTFDNIYSNITPSSSRISSYTAPTDGWFYGYVNSTTSSASNVGVLINGNNAFGFVGTGQSIGLFPLKKGQTISVNNGYFTTSSCFYGV